jgi:transposase-like protein
MSLIEAALAAIESLKPSERLNYAQIAREYGVVPSTLARRHKGASTPRTTTINNQRALHPHQEQELLRYIKRLTCQCLPPTRPMIRNFASQIAGRELGVNWVDRFCRRYSEDLISTWAGSMDRNRCRANSGVKYKLYFNLLSQKQSQYNIKPQYTYNIDKKGFLLGVVTKLKRVFSKSVYERGKLRLYIQDGN